MLEQLVKTQKTDFNSLVRVTQISIASLVMSAMPRGKDYCVAAPPKLRPVDLPL